MRELIKCICFFVVITFTACQKYLDKKPHLRIAAPSTPEDFQSLLDNFPNINQKNPSLMELLSDNYYVTSQDWNSIRSLDQRMNYIWDRNATSFNDWQFPYSGPVYYSNVVLEGLKDIEMMEGDEALFKNLKGAALFYRSFAFFQLAQIYCEPYSQNANADLGIVLKLSGDIGEKYRRSTVQQTYDQIISDLKDAVTLLPKKTALSSRPNKAAALGALARTYLSMRDYNNAGLYANLCLQEDSTLMDYNNITNFLKFNSETVYYSFAIPPDILFPPTAKIDSTLFDSYNIKDLRRKLFFFANSDGSHSFNGSYCGLAGFIPFDGITNAEMYLIRAESAARTGNVSAAMKDLNYLLQRRWDSNFPFVPITATDKDDALNKILIERRKELVYRGLRWSDIRRLNVEGANISLTRIINGARYELPPNDKRFVMLIPREEINLSGIDQNIR